MLPMLNQSVHRYQKTQIDITLPVRDTHVCVFVFVREILCFYVYVCVFLSGLCVSVLCGLSIITSLSHSVFAFSFACVLIYFFSKCVFVRVSECVSLCVSNGVSICTN